MRQLWFLVAGDPGQLTGGYLYDARISAALAQTGMRVKTVGLDGRFPDADANAATAFSIALAAIPTGGTAVIDGLVLGGLPEVVATHSHRLHLIALVHHPLADEYGIDPDLAERLYASERQALEHVHRVIVTSRFTAQRLIGSYGIEGKRLNVVEPGIDKPIMASHDAMVPRLLLCVATLIPRKGHLILLDALTRIVDLPWRCDCIGDTNRDRGYTELVRSEINKHDLSGRIQLRGVVSDEALQSAYETAWAFVLASFFEGYGMVIGEALVHGVPVVTTTGGALADTLPPQAGVTVPPGDAAALAGALRRVLTDDALRMRLASGARRAASALQDWEQAAARFAAALYRVETTA